MNSLKYGDIFIPIVLNRTISALIKDMVTKMEFILEG